MNTEIPTNIGESTEVLHSQIDKRHVSTGACVNEINDVRLKNAKWEAIAQYKNGKGITCFFVTNRIICLILIMKQSKMLKNRLNLNMKE